MKKLTTLSATTLLAAGVFFSVAHSAELSTELHNVSTKQLENLQPAMAYQAYQAMLQTVIDVKAHQQAKQDASSLLAANQISATVSE